MSKHILFAFLIIFSFPFGESWSGAFAQNLVPNPSFEEGPNRTSAEWTYGLKSDCTFDSPIVGPDYWTVVKPTPDRMIEGDIPCNWDNDTAQSGSSYIVLGISSGIYGESGKATLISPIQKDSIYLLSYYVSRETFRGASTQPYRCAFIFNADTLISSYIVDNEWEYRDTIFTSTSNANEIQIMGYGTEASATKIDNISLIKVFPNSIDKYALSKKSFFIFPNPANNFITIKNNYFINYNVNIIDAIGNVLINYDVDMNEHKLDTSSLPQGLYLIKLTTENYSTIQKLIITK